MTKEVETVGDISRLLAGANHRIEQMSFFCRPGSMQQFTQFQLAVQQALWGVLGIMSDDQARTTIAMDTVIPDSLKPRIKKFQMWINSENN